MCIKAAFHSQAERGLSLIELLVFIVIVGIAATAILGVFGSLTRSSASLLPDKQAQAIAASMLQEVLAHPFTAADNTMGPEGAEARNGATPFNSVNDYDSVAFPPVALPNQPPATGVGASLPGAYTYQITVAPIIPPLPNVTPNDALLVTVVVAGPNGAAARLQGVRIRYAP